MNQEQQTITKLIWEHETTIYAQQEQRFGTLIAPAIFQNFRIENALDHLQNIVKTRSHFAEDLYNERIKKYQELLRNGVAHIYCVITPKTLNIDNYVDVFDQKRFYHKDPNKESKIVKGGCNAFYLILPDAEKDKLHLYQYLIQHNGFSSADKTEYIILMNKEMLRLWYYRKEYI